MRDRKYRVWGTSNEYPEGKMYYPGDLPIVITLFGDPIHAPTGNKIEDCCYMRVGWNDVDVMDYTGLHDCKGTSIYEGDIVELDDIRCPITWDDGGFQMITSASQGRSPAMQERLKKWEVIGNIHQHPDLIRKG